MTTEFDHKLAQPIAITKQRWEENSIPLVSIINNTFNQEKYIRESIEGFLMQETTFPVEILIHDDASTDNTAEIIREYESKYPKIIFAIYQKQNQYSAGISVTRAFQYPRAKGNYIAFCEGDDYWTDPLKLEKQIRFMEQNKNFSYCGHKSYVRDRDELKPLEMGIEIIDFKTVVKKNPLNTSTLVFRKEATDTSKLSLPEIKAGDWFMQMFAMQFGNAYVLKDYMSVYRRHEGGIWSALTSNEMCQFGVDTLESVKLIYKNRKARFLINKAITDRRISFRQEKRNIFQKIKLYYYFIFNK